MSKKNINTVEDYVNSFPKEVKDQLQVLRKTIREEIPDPEEVISYKIAAFKSKGRMVIYFAGWKDHLSMYPFSAAMEEEFPESKNYKTSGKGTIQFRLDEPLPLPLIKKIVRFRVKENEEKASARK